MLVPSFFVLKFAVGTAGVVIAMVSGLVVVVTVMVGTGWWMLLWLQ